MPYPLIHEIHSDRWPWKYVLLGTTMFPWLRRPLTSLFQHSQLEKSCTNVFACFRKETIVRIKLDSPFGADWFNFSACSGAQHLSLLWIAHQMGTRELGQDKSCWLLGPTAGTQMHPAGSRPFCRFPLKSKNVLSYLMVFGFSATQKEIDAFMFCKGFFDIIVPGVSCNQIQHNLIQRLLGPEFAVFAHTKFPLTCRPCWDLNSSELCFSQVPWNCIKLHEQLSLAAGATQIKGAGAVVKERFFWWERSLKVSVCHRSSLVKHEAILLPQFPSILPPHPLMLYVR